MKLKIFISSVQDEFAEERRGLKDWLSSDPFLSRFVENVFLFEDTPSRGIAPDAMYIDEVKNSDIYIGLVGSSYYGGNSCKQAVSATEAEYLAACEARLERLIYVKTCGKRDKKESDFLRKITREVKHSAFNEFNDLKTAVYLSMIEYLDVHGMIELGNFDKSICLDMKKSDIDVKRVKWYLREMRERRRKAALPLKTAPMDLMTHLGLVKDGRFTWGAALLFSKNPQLWCYRATLKCTWCEGVEFDRPFLDTDKFEGNLFSLLEQGVDFVMSRIAQSRGIRDKGSQVPFRNELPREAVEEAIVNALVHRDWRQTASVDVRLFADRLEVWTPGKLPDGVTIEKLYEIHSSYPVNELILRAFDHCGIIESLGTGIQRMLDACRKNGNPAPEFRQNGPSFIVTLWKDMWTPLRLAQLRLNERQLKAVPTIKHNGCITPKEYMAITGASCNTATRDLMGMMNKGFVKRSGSNRDSLYKLILFTIYSSSSIGTVNITSNIEHKDTEDKITDNNYLNAINVSENNGKNCATKEDIKMSDDTVSGLRDGTVYNEALGRAGELLTVIKKHPGCRANKLAEIMGKGLRTVKRYLSALVLLDLIEFRGAPKNGGYFIVERIK